MFSHVNEFARLHSSTQPWSKHWSLQSHVPHVQGQLIDANRSRSHSYLPTCWQYSKFLSLQKSPAKTYENFASINIKRVCRILTMHKTINVSCSYAPMVLAFTSWTSTRIYLEEEIVSTPRKVKKVSLISMVMITTDFGKISCLVVTSANVVSESICV